MVRTTLLLGALTGIIMGIGHLLGGSQGLVIAFVFAVIMNFGSYWFSDQIVLAMYGARQVSEAEAPMLYRIVHNLALRAGIPMPKLYIIPSESPNAFATGRSPQHAAVAATEGILRLMNERELTGVLAHELSHAKNRHILIRSMPRRRPLTSSLSIRGPGGRSCSCSARTRRWRIGLSGCERWPGSEPE